MHGLRNLYPFLKDEDYTLLKDISVFGKLPKKELVFSQNGISFDFVYIHRGMIRGYYITESGEEKTIFIGNDGLFIGAPEGILKGEPSKYYFETVVETEFYRFDFRKLEKIAVNNVNIFKFYNATLKKILGIFIDRIEGFTSYSPEQRYIDLHDKRPLIISNAHKKQIATFLGISPNSLSRIISRINSNNCKSSK